MVLVTAAVGFMLGLGVVPRIGPGPIAYLSTGGALPLALFFHTLAGTALVARRPRPSTGPGARARRPMRRTADRPLPAGRIEALTAPSPSPSPSGSPGVPGWRSPSTR